MRLLIDSHAFIWWAEASPALGVVARRAIADPANDPWVSVAGLWELTIKSSSGRLTLPADLQAMVIRLGFSVLAIGFDHLRQYGALSRIHRDPFDRMMIAQALAEGIPVVTCDSVFATYGVQIVW